MNISYNVSLPKKIKKGGNRSDESNALLAFLKDGTKRNMSISYNGDIDIAKRKAATMKAFMKKRGLKDKVEIYRVDDSIYIDKKEGV